jgi:hypothetical protein
MKPPAGVQTAKRSLILVPIVHTLEDLGSQKDLVVRASLRTGGRMALKKKTAAIKELWKRIESYVDGLELQWEQVKVFQDALPVSGREEEIVTELARAGSLNHQLILRLVERGAALVGTESPELLVAEYEMVKKTLESGGHRSKSSRRRGQADPILTERDQFIANRINRTLRPGETGILFLGLLHSVEPFLEADIKVVRPSLAAESCSRTV